MAKNKYRNQSSPEDDNEINPVMFTFLCYYLLYIAIIACCFNPFTAPVAITVLVILSGFVIPAVATFLTFYIHSKFTSKNCTEDEEKKQTVSPRKGPDITPKQTENQTQRKNPAKEAFYYLTIRGGIFARNVKEYFSPSTNIPRIGHPTIQ